MVTTRAQIEAKMARTRGASGGARERLATAGGTWNDWRGSCTACGHARQGHISELSKPCPKCGYGVGAGE